jgi:NAD(P)-dependent dehydrogenase (short-subunit alcohol dehydrogenase family)
MSATAIIVRALRRVTDGVALFSFNRLGFELNRLGFDRDDMPSDAGGRVALVTGANSGIGRATAVALARCGFDVWLLCRDAARGEAARDAVAREGGAERAHLGIVDMSSLVSIRRFALDFPVSRVDVLVHNAGVLPRKRQLSQDGVELAFATSVLGPFALTRLLVDRLERSFDARVIFVASGGLYLQRLDLSLVDAGTRRFDGPIVYANAKRAQVVLGHILANRLSLTSRITFASMHPGWVDTTALRASLPQFHAVMKPFLRTPEQGADTVVWLAASARAKETSGKFWFDRQVAREYPLPWTRESDEAQTKLLRLCEALSGLSFETAGSRSVTQAM